MPCDRRNPKSTQEGTAKILAAVNEYNELLYDLIIPHLFNELYTITQEDKTEEYEVGLVKVPERGFYEMNAAKEMVIIQGDVEKKFASKSFHLDKYCFDSDPEKRLFWDLIRDGRVKQALFHRYAHPRPDRFLCPVY